MLKTGVSEYPKRAGVKIVPALCILWQSLECGRSQCGHPISEGQTAGTLGSFYLVVTVPIARK